MSSPFSKRHGYRHAAPITVREEAPARLREGLVMIASEEGLSADSLRWAVCQALRRTPDRGNWSGENVWNEAASLIEGCEWFEVYDIAEKLHAQLAQLARRPDVRISGDPDSFAAKLNDLMIEVGIGWKMVDGQIEFRGGEGFERAVQNAKADLEAAKRSTAESEMHEALRDLSRRPTPDRTGAVQHAMAALECLARDVTGDKKTLGDLLSRYKTQLAIPEPLHTAVEKAWGFASDRGRHLREGREPTAAEAELIVSLCAALVTFLSTKAGTTAPR